MSNKITADIIEAFTGSVLAANFDNPKPIPAFHRELWEKATSDDRLVALAAPRGHAKSTSITLCYLLAAILFREKKFAIIISDTEAQAIRFLGDIKMELADNEDLRALFEIKEGKFIKDNEKDIIVSFKDGSKFRIMAFGSGGQIRGTKWHHLRPDLIIGDDLENDEIVMNQDRREKFREWFFASVVPTLSDHGQIRIVGTILHMDSLLMRLMTDESWNTALYEAHNADFTEILWPEQFSEEKLKLIRQSYISQGMPEKYSQEYLNNPIDGENAYFRIDDFRYYTKDDIANKHLSYYTAVDFAISKRERADFTVILTVGIDSENKIYVVDVRKGRWDGKEIIDEMFSVQKRYEPDVFTAEQGMIERTLGAFLRDEMFRRNTFMNLNPMAPIADKQQRARAIQARIKAGGVFFDKDASWFASIQQEMLRFPRDVHDDQVDALAWIGLTVDKIVPGLSVKEQSEELWHQEFDDTEELVGFCHSTGY